MEKFKTLTAKAVPLPMKDVDTDMIIPAQFLTSTSRDGYAKGLFRRLRDSDPTFPLNLPKFSEAKILIADSNFGCGSSREHAVWALLGSGIRVVICKSFADIFTSNSAKNGLVLVVLPPADVDALLLQAQSGNLQLTVNLDAQQVDTPTGQKLSFEFDPFRKHCILNGLDDLDYILSHKEQIKKFREMQNVDRVYSTVVENN